MSPGRAWRMPLELRPNAECSNQLVALFAYFSTFPPLNFFTFPLFHFFPLSGAKNALLFAVESSTRKTRRSKIRMRESACDVLTRNISIGKYIRGRRPDYNGDAIVRESHPAYPFRPSLDRTAPQTLFVIKNTGFHCPSKRCGSQSLRFERLS